MGIKNIVTKKTLYTCDRCGHETENDLDRGSYLNIKASLVSIGYDGGTGGRTNNYYFCGHCAQDFHDFLNN